MVCHTGAGCAIQALGAAQQLRCCHAMMPWLSTEDHQRNQANSLGHLEVQRPPSEGHTLLPLHLPASGLVAQHVVGKIHLSPHFFTADIGDGVVTSRYQHTSETMYAATEMPNKKRQGLLAQ